MTTFEKVLEVFSAYLAEDNDYEIINTRHGYTVLCWDKHAKSWDSSEYCETPEDMANLLANDYATFLEIKIGGGARELTKEERDGIEMERQKMLKLCEIE